MALVRGSKSQRRRQRGFARPGICYAVGSKLYQLVRRRPRTGNYIWRVSWRWLGHVSCSCWRREPAKEALQERRNAWEENSVNLQANNGQAIAASSYLVAQYDYNATVPTQRYSQFAKAAGCDAKGNVFECLVGKDTLSLQYANSNVSSNQTYGTWAFLPVTDGVYVTQLASVQLDQKKVNGVNLFVGVSNWGAMRRKRVLLILSEEQCGRGSAVRSPEYRQRD